MIDIAIKERIHNVVDSIGGNSSAMARVISTSFTSAKIFPGRCSLTDSCTKAHRYKRLRVFLK